MNALEVDRGTSHKWLLVSTAESDVFAPESTLYELTRSLFLCSYADPSAASLLPPLGNRGIIYLHHRAPCLWTLRDIEVGHRDLAIGSEAAAFTPRFGNEIPFDAEAIKDEAWEEGFEIPVETTLENARTLSTRLLDFQVDPSNIAIYPMPDGEVAIHISKGPEGERSSILFLCTSRPMVRCLTHIKGISKKDELSLSAFPNDFVCGAFVELKDIGHEGNPV